MRVLFFLIINYLLLTQTSFSCILGNSINNYTGFNGILDTICIGDTMTIKWTQYEGPYRENFSFSWTGMEEYFYVLSPYDRDSLVLVPKTIIIPEWNYINWRAAIRWHDIQINTIDSCSNFDETFPIYCLPKSSFIADEQTICSNNCVQFTNKSSHLPTELHWYFEGGIPAEFIGDSPPPICYEQAGQFGVWLISTNQVGTDTLFMPNFITVYDAPQGTSSNTTLQLEQGETAVLTPCATALHYDWYSGDELLCADCPTYNATLYQDKVIRCMAYNNSNAPCDISCTYDIAIIGITEGVLIPNAFSPNQDGTNDCLRAMPYHVTIDKLSIYNRWGALIYEQTTPDTCWDGSYLGKDAEQGVYIYTIQYTRWHDQQQQLSKGFVTLIR